MKSLDLLREEYDVLNKFRDRAFDKISTLEKPLKQLSTEVSKAIVQVQEYSYSYNLKLVGFPELEPRENAFQTLQLCSVIYIAIEVHVKPYDIDIAHRMTPRHAAE